MDRDSNKDSFQEMEQIRRGLEEFLNQEVLNQKPSNEENTDGEVENQEMRDRYQSGREPQFFTIGEDDEEEEREIDIIGTQNQKRNTKARRIAEEDYIEDWDSPKRSRRADREEEEPIRKKSGSASTGSKKSGAKSSGVKNSGGGSQSGKGGQASSRRNESPKSGKKKKKKKSKFKKFLIIVAVLAILFCAGWYYMVGKVYTKMNYGEIESVASEPMKEEGVVNILLIGNDSRNNGDDGRSDAMILLSISDKTKKIYMSSLLRDMYVEIPGYKANRLNAAYSYGGPELLMETIEQNLDISVNRYVSVNFESFASLVDAVGGVDLELTSEEIEYVNGYLVEYNILTERPEGTDYMDTSVSGMVHLNGPQALAYCRNRYLGTDFGRTERQRKVLSGIIQNAPKALLNNPKTLMDELLPNLTTNLTQSELLRLSLMAEKLLTYDIVQNSIPIEGSYQNATIRDMAVLEVDFEANKQFLKQNIYGEGVAVEATENAQ